MAEEQEAAGHERSQLLLGSLLVSGTKPSLFEQHKLYDILFTIFKISSWKQISKLKTKKAQLQQGASEAAAGTAE